MNNWQIVIASSDAEMRGRVIQILDRLGLGYIVATSVGQCLAMLEREHVGLIFCDRNLSDGSYLEILGPTNSDSARRIRVVLMSSLMEPNEYHVARRSGLFELISVPCRPTDVEWMIIRAKREELSRTVAHAARLIRSPYAAASSVAN
jgi:DNA-binding NtrC family response regulator